MNSCRVNIGPSGHSKRCVKNRFVFSKLFGWVARSFLKKWSWRSTKGHKYTKTLSNFTILSYRDVDTSVLPLFTSKALFVAGKGCFEFTKIGPKKCEGSRNFPIVWFLQLGFSRRLEWLKHPKSGFILDAINTSFVSSLLFCAKRNRGTSCLGTDKDQE